MTTKKENETCCPSCGKKIYFYSLSGEQGDMTLSIPAIDDSNAASILDDMVKNPEAWKRERKLEESMQGMRTRGRLVKDTRGPGAMFG